MKKTCTILRKYKKAIRVAKEEKKFGEGGRLY
jgi:hypothetical protein